MIDKMAKSWDQMSKEERQAAGGNKKEYNKSTGQERYAEGGSLEHRSEAKERTQVHAATSQNSAALNNEHSPKANDVGVQAKPAPSINKGTGPNNHYSAADNMSPLEKQMVERKNQQKAYADKKSTGFEQASAYLAQGNSRDKQYDQILRDAGTNNSEFQNYTNANRKQQYEANKLDKQKSNDAYRQSRLDMQAAKKAGTEGKNTFAVDDTAYYQKQKQDTGLYHKDAERNLAIEGLMGTGQKFGSLDIERELGSGSTHSQDGLYKTFGGIENYNENYSVGSGNFQSRYGANEYMTSEEAQGVRDQRTNNLGDYMNNAGLEKYGQYDWFQKDLGRFNNKNNIG